jgi:hypothetical protein
MIKPQNRRRAIMSTEVERNGSSLIANVGSPAIVRAASQHREARLLNSAELCSDDFTLPGRT